MAVHHGSQRVDGDVVAVLAAPMGRLQAGIQVLRRRAHRPDEALQDAGRVGVEGVAGATRTDTEGQRACRLALHAHEKFGVPLLARGCTAGKRR